MAEISHPHTGQPTASEDQWRQMGRLFTGTGVVDDVADQLAPSADGTALITTIAAGRAFVDGFAYDSDAPVEMVHAPADPANDRIDVVVVRYDPAAAGPTDGRVRLAIVEGVPDPAPVAPALTQEPDGMFELALAEVVVTGGSAVIAAVDVTDVRRYVGSVRDRQGTTAERLAVEPEVGTFWWDTDAIAVYRYDGASWERVGAPPVDVQTFDASGTWTKPAGAVAVSVVAVGGGAGGSSGHLRNGANADGGSGGGSAAVGLGSFDADEVPSSVTVTVGAGGTGGAARGPGGGTADGFPGGAGGDSSFGDRVRAPGATAAPTSTSVSRGGGMKGDAYWNATSATAFLVAGATSQSLGGANGFVTGTGSAQNGSPPLGGGAGGSGSYFSGGGVLIEAGKSAGVGGSAGGDGGDGGLTQGQSGADGDTPGGGGGGGAGHGQNGTSGSGGDGGDGRVTVITYF